MRAQVSQALQGASFSSFDEALVVGTIDGHATVLAARKVHPIVLCSIVSQASCHRVRASGDRRLASSVLAGPCVLSNILWGLVHGPWAHRRTAGPMVP
jgi:hypothetical protein